jgi:chemotaxis protein CheD
VEGFLESYFLNPGELIFAKHPILIKTVLGSCVAVVVYDKKNGYGGMCHYLLPESEDKVRSTKYGNVAVATLINKFINAGSVKNDLEASVVGGAFIIFSDKEIFFIGDRNADVANRILREQKIPIKSINTGGDKGKKVVFDTGNNQLIVSNIGELTMEDMYRERKVVH